MVEQMFDELKSNNLNTNDEKVLHGMDDILECVVGLCSGKNEDKFDNCSAKIDSKARRFSCTGGSSSLLFVVVGRDAVGWVD